MYGDVRTTVSDGLLGFGTEKGTGIFVAIGASPVSAIEPVTITANMNAEKMKASLGLSPLADSVMDSVENGAGRIYCIPVKPSIEGTIGTVHAEKEGSGELGVSGKPHNAYQVIAKITGKGELNSALFTYSIDGGMNYQDEQTIPVTGKFIIPETGLTLSFTEGLAGAESEDSFQIGDTYDFITSAPRMSNDDVLGAIEGLRYFNAAYELVHIVGESEPAMWAAVSAAQKELEGTHNKPLLFILEAYDIGADETLEAYALRLENDRKQIKNWNIQVVAGRALYSKMDGRIQEQNCAGIVCGLYARTEVQKSIGRTRSSYGLGIRKEKMIELRPRGIKEYLELIDAASYLTFRDYDGLEGYYVASANVMSPPGSDYRYAEDVRVLNKMIRKVREAALPLLQEDIDIGDTQGELERLAKFMEVPLDTMTENKEISSAEVTVPEGQDVIKNEDMEVLIRYVSRGYIRTVRVDIGRANISIST